MNPNPARYSGIACREGFNWRFVPRPRSSEISLRNDQIYAEWRAGRSLSWLADKYQRTPQQMGRIVADRHPDLEDDLDRSLHRGRLETLYEEVQSLVDNPGWKLAPNGRLAQDDDGNALYDTSAKIEALKLKLLVLESARKLDARDKAAKPRGRRRPPEAGPPRQGGEPPAPAARRGRAADVGGPGRRAAEDGGPSARHGGARGTGGTEAQAWRSEEHTSE